MTLPSRILLIAILASFVAFLDGSVVNVALPAISEELGGGLATQQWVVDAYLITLGALILTAGSLADIFGRKRMLAYGLVGFGVTSVLCAVAPNATFLVVARALQGVAGALLVPSSLALIMSSFTGVEQGKAIGRWTAWTGIAFIIGPLLGGIMVDVLSWRLIFAINVLPIAILGAVDSKFAGVGSAVNNAVARIAGLVAIAGSGLVVGNTVDLDGFKRGIMATALLLAVGGVISAVGIQNARNAAKDIV
ncbi:MAG TPA: MFS transporter [Candidatus Saccharimonadales bacterium]|jgi:MFS family permease